jgi:hypothetical protein
MSSSARSDSSASESEDSAKDPFAQPTDKQLVHPSPVEYSDSNAEASLSQYRMEMAGKQTDDCT